MLFNKRVLDRIHEQFDRSVGTVRDARDRSLLLIGFAGAFRRSELSAVDCKWIERTASGLVITIPKSKTDQEGQARQVAIPRGRNAICPIKALEQWLERSGITEGPVFRPVTRRGQVRSALGRLHRVDREA